MAFTHDHINAFVIVGGDSDFISLIEKLKQYGRKVFVVGGRQFTSLTMQKNCHEFIAYENLVGARSGRSGGRGDKPASASADIAKALPLVKRALKVLSDREVAPQLGLLKSTLLQLDSTFSEREYGANTFRDFMEKVAQTGAVTLKNAGRSTMVESREDGQVEVAVPQGESSAPGPFTTSDEHVRAPRNEAAPRHEIASAAVFDVEDDETLPPSPMTMQDGIRAVQQAFAQAAPPPRWPMYVRQAKQFLKGRIEGFDERKYGFASVVDLLRAAGKEGVLKLERDRHGAFRVFAGAKLTAPVTRIEVEEPAVDAAGEVLDEQPVGAEGESVEEPPIVDVQPIDVPEAGSLDAEEPQPVDGDVMAPYVEEAPKKGARKRKTPSRARAAKAETRKTDKGSRARKGTRTKAEAANR
jgi:hypothetical protein